MSRFLAFFAAAAAIMGPAWAEVSIYAHRTGGGENTYKSEYGRSGDWIVSCTEQVEGSAPGTKWCSLQPTSGRRFGGDGFYEAAPHGLDIQLWRNPPQREAMGIIAASLKSETAAIDLTPLTRLSPTASYVVACGGHEIAGFAPDAESVGYDAYSGPQAAAVLSAMRSADDCAIVIEEGGKSSSATMSVAGFNDALAYAAGFTGVDIN